MRRSLHSRRGPRRKKVWANRQATLTGQGAGSPSISGVDLLSDYVTAGGSTQGVTVIRTVLQIVVESTTGGQFFNTAREAYFGLMVSELAPVATTDEDPLARPHLDWAWNEMYLLGQPNANQPSLILPASTASSGMMNKDIRSRRKIEEIGQSWLLCFNTPTAAQAAGITFVIHGRTLLLLP